MVESRLKLTAARGVWRLDSTLKYVVQSARKVAIRMFEFESTTDKILRVLIENDSEKDINKKLGAVQKAFPRLSQQQINSAINDLANDKLIVTLRGDDKVSALNVQPYALSRLTTRREINHWNLKWDLVNIH